MILKNAQTRSFATIESALRNALPSSLHLIILSGSLPASFCLLKTLGFLHWEHY